VTIEGGLGLGGVLGEEREEERVGRLALPACGLKEAAQDAVILQSLGGAGAMDDFVQDHHRAQTALGLIVGGRDVGVAEAGEEVRLLGAQQPLTKGLRLGVAQGAARTAAIAAAPKGVGSWY